MSLNQRFLALLLLFCMNGHSQDTVNLVSHYDGYKTFWLISKTDTFIIGLYPGGKTESKRRVRSGVETGLYHRWYENGKPMWEKNMVNTLAIGLAAYFDTSGTMIARFNYKDGRISDTLFLMEGIHIIFGKITFNSKVYGGAVREDGTGDISEHTGPYVNCVMNAVMVDSLKKPVLISRVRTDYNGEFFMSAPAGTIAFFPAGIPLDQISPGEYHIPELAWDSGEYAWKRTDPLKISKQKILTVHLHLSSVGYAP